MATLLTDQGEVEYVVPKHNTFDVEEVCAILDCAIAQLVILPNGCGMWIDADGKNKLGRWRQINTLATELIMLASGGDGDYVVGDVVLTNPEEISSGDDV